MDFSPLISALGAVGGGMLTANSIDAQNAVADRQFNANLAFQKYQYEDMKKWQSPSNQVRLLREAGLNPALALQSSLAGSSLSSVGGVSPTASMTSASYNDLPSVAGNLMQAFTQNELLASQEAKNYADASSTLQDTIGKSIENAYKHGDIELAQYLTKQQGRLVKSESDFNEGTLDRRIEGEQFKTALLMGQMEAQGISNKWLDKIKAQEYESLVVQISALVASRKLSLSQASEVVARKIATYGLDDTDAEDLFDETMDLMDSQIESNYGSAINTTDGDVKSNPFTLALRGGAVARVNNRLNSIYRKRYQRKQYREQRRKSKR